MSLERKADGPMSNPVEVSPLTPISSTEPVAPTALTAEVVRDPLQMWVRIGDDGRPELWMGDKFLRHQW